MKSGKGKLVALAFLILQLSVAGLALQTENKLKLGKQDDITLMSVTKVGNLTLRPGHYILRHRTSDGKHAMHFVSFVPYGGETGHGRTYYPAGYGLPSNRMGKSDAGEPECRIEPLKTTVKRTQVFFVNENGGKRITRVEIKGENVAHLF